MDKIEKLYQSQLEFICDEYRNKIYPLPSWQLNSRLPKEIQLKDLDEKIEYLMENYKRNNPVYLLLNTDLELLKEGNVFYDDFKSLNVDPRYLESIGLTETQIDNYYEFVNSVKALF